MTTIEQILTQVDLLNPNSYSKEQKLFWYNQCESIISTKAIKSYGYIETTVRGGLAKLPDGYTKEDIACTYLDGKPGEKLDLRSGLPNLDEVKNAAKIGMVVLQRPGAVELEEYEGSIQLQGNSIILTRTAFCAGDSIDILSDTETRRTSLLGVGGNILYCSTDFDSEEFNGKIEKALNIPVLAQSPYDKLYVDYIIAQMDYYSKDFESYNNNSFLFNETLNELIAKNKKNEPVFQGNFMRNLW